MICYNDPRHPFNAIGGGKKQEKNTYPCPEKHNDNNHKRKMETETRFDDHQIHLQCALSDWEWDLKTKVENFDPNVPMSPKKENGSNDDDDVNVSESIFCAICTEPVRKNELVRILLTCDHLFHQQCIDTWLERNHLCPICKQSVKQYVPK